MVPAGRFNYIQHAWLCDLRNQAEKPATWPKHVLLPTGGGEPFTAFLKSHQPLCSYFLGVFATYCYCISLFSDTAFPADNASSPPHSCTVASSQLSCCLHLSSPSVARQPTTQENKYQHKKLFSSSFPLILLTDVCIRQCFLPWVVKVFVASPVQQVPLRQGPARIALIPNHSLLPCDYLLSTTKKCVTTGSSSKFFLLVNEEAPPAHNREFRCTFLHIRINRISYLFIFKTLRWLLCTFDLLSVWAAISYSQEVSAYCSEDAFI